MIVQHYAAVEKARTDFRSIPAEEQSPGLLRDGYGPIGKPIGTWITVPEGNPSWNEWCEGEGFALHGLAYLHEIVLADDALLHIARADQLDAFHRYYARDVWAEEGMSGNYTKYMVDWRRVQRETGKAGILIAPYFWAYRLGRMDAAEGDITNQVSDWYYGWDCASGCIWDAKAIVSVTCRPYHARDRRALELEEN